MRSWKHKLYFFVTLAVVSSSCIESFQPVITATAGNILVVEGFINYTENSAHIQLAHALRLDATVPPEPETQATVTIEEENGAMVALAEEVPSNYSVSNLTLDIAKKYRLNIQTKDGRVYQSEFITIQETPPIDSITWQPDATGVTVLANTHDNITSASRYYSWNFTETWEYMSPYTSFLKYENGIVVDREIDEYYNTCWSSADSKGILIGSTKQLTNDVVKDFPIQRLSKGTTKLSKRYSVLVKQKKISEEEYNYWTLLKKTTQNLGGLFDPLPAQVTGNIICTTHPTEPVLGYFSGGTIEEKRIFINTYDLPNNLRVFPSNSQCEIDSIEIADVVGHPGPLFIITYYGMPVPLGYLTTARECIDCRVFGGLTTKPDFW